MCYHTLTRLKLSIAHLSCPRRARLRSNNFFSCECASFARSAFFDRKFIAFSYQKKIPQTLVNQRFAILSKTCVRRFELPTPWSVAKCSIQLSYTHIFYKISLKANAGDRNRTGTMSPPQDFKSCASASSATPA